MTSTDELEALLRDLRTDKVALRQKAFSKLSSLCSSHRKSLNKIFEGNEYLSYDRLFEFAHEGIKQQGIKLGDVDVNEGENRIKVYSLGIHDTLAASLDAKTATAAMIKSESIVEASLEVLKLDTLRKHFGNTYLSLLNSTLNSSLNMTAVQCEDWKGLLKVLIKMLKLEDPKFKFLFLVDCAQKVVRAGCDYSYLACEIVKLKVFDNIKLILSNRTSNNSVKEKQEVLMLTYYCCRDIATDYRFELCKFLEDITVYINSAFMNDNHEKYRPFLFQLMNLALVVHNPNFGISGDNSHMEFVHDRKKWHTSLRNYEMMLLEELKLIKTVYRERQPPKVNCFTSEFAARFCYYVYWNDEIWNENIGMEDDVQNPKRKKLTNKLQTIIERIRPQEDSSTNFNWKWFIVLCELISYYPASVQNDDYIEILKIMSECQHLIEFKEQVYAFTKICSVLLQREGEFKSTANTIIFTHCQNLWMKISDEAARSCSNSNKNIIESHKLLQLLIYHHKYSANTFIESVIKIFTSKSIIKCDMTLQTLIVILKSFNMDSLVNGKSLVKELLEFGFEKITLATLKKVIAGYEKPSYKTLAHFAIICCLLKTDVINYYKKRKVSSASFYDNIIDLEEQREYRAYVESIVENMLLKTRGKLIIECDEFSSFQEGTTKDSNSEALIELKCMIDEDIFKELMRLTELQEKLIDQNSSVLEIKDHLKDVMTNNELMLNLLSELLSMESTNQKRMENLFITKRIVLNVQEIERLFKLISEKKIEFDTSDTNKIATALHLMFKNDFHPEVGKLIRNYQLKNCLKWIFEQVDRTFTSSDENANNKLTKKAFLSAKTEYKLRYLLVTTLCEYFNYDGCDSEYVAELVDKIEFNYEDNVDLHTIFRVIEIFGRQKNIPEDAAVWIWEAGIVYVCKFHNHNLYMMNTLIEKIAEMKYFTVVHEDLTKHFSTLFSSFSKLCTLDGNNKRFFGPNIVTTYLQQFKHYHEMYFTEYNNPVIKRIYEKVFKEFLISPCFEVKMTAISTLSNMLCPIRDGDMTIEDQKLINQSRKNLYKDFITSYQYVVPENFDMFNDEDVNSLSTHVQLFVSLFCVNFNFRKNNLFEMAKIFIRFNLSEREGMNIFEKIMKRLKHVYAQSIVNINDIVDLLSKWIEMSMEMCKFPWYLIGSESYQGFINEYYNLILLAALKTREDVVDDFLTSVELSLDVAALPIISSCLAFIIPSKANCVIRYGESALEMDEKLRTAFTEQQLNVLIQQNLAEIVVKIIENVVDNHMFLDMTGIQMDFCAGYETIKISDFEKCMSYLKEVCMCPADRTLISYLCETEPSQIQQIFMLQKKNIQGTESVERKLLSLLHYNILLTETIDYMNETDNSVSKSVKEYLSRETANYLCHLIANKNSGEKIPIIAADSLKSYLQKIIPACSVFFKPQLQKIVPELVTVCKDSNVSQKLKAKCFEIMNFLVLDQPYLKEAIAVLDRFPSHYDFEKLRAKQLEIKYHDGDFVLLEEIEHFLEIKNRRIEGLMALSEHLSTKKSELKYLFEELDSMSSDKGKSTLHRLIRVLIKTVRENDEERAVEAIKCLGEIGCHNISTITFHAEDRECDTSYQSFSTVIECQQTICNKILEKLESVLSNNNVKIFQAASDACYYLLKSASSITFKPSSFFNPFLPDKKSSENLFYIEPKGDKILEMQKFMIDNNFIEYSTFIKGLCEIMTEFAGDKYLVYLIQTQLEFAEMIFPQVFHLLLLYNSDKVNVEIISSITYYFEQCSEKLKYSEHTNEGSIFINKKIIRQMLKLAEKVRVYCQENCNCKMAEKQNLNFLHIAKAAKHCEAFFTAIQYCEMWARKRLELDGKESVPFVESFKDKTLQDVMYRSYAAIGIKEASEIYLNPVANRTEYLKNNDLNFQCLLEVSKQASLRDYLKLIDDVGLYHISNKVNENLDASKKSQQYECLWKLCEWNTVVEVDSEIKDEKGLIDYDQEFEKYHYLSLQYAKNNDAVGLRNSVHKSRKMIQQLISHHSLECSNSLYKFLEMAHRLVQIEDFSKILFKRTVNSHEILIEKWNVHDKLPFDYGNSKKIFLQRNSILSTANIKAGKRTWIPDVIQSNSLFLIKQSVLAGQKHDAIKLITHLRDEITTVPRKMEVLVEEAKLNMFDNKELAKSCLNQVINNLETNLITQSTAHRLYGEILAENFSEDLSYILTNYLEQSMRFLEKYSEQHKKAYLIANLTNEVEMSQFSQAIQTAQEEKDSSVDAKIRQGSCIYETIARYNDREYEFKSSYITSSDFIQKKTTFAKNAERLKILAQKITGADADSRKSFVILKKSTELDKIEIENAEKEKKFAARNAIYYYLRSTVYSTEDNILSIFRIVSLMLENVPKSSFIMDFLTNNILKIPSYKFIVALPQITARINDQDKDPLNNLLKMILKRCAIDHPHHTLPLILALVNSYADSTKDDVDEPRVLGAKKLWKTLKLEVNLKTITNEMERMSSALIHLANLPLKTSNIPSDHKVLQMRNLNNVQCPTVELAIMKSGDYRKTVVSVQKWQPTAKSVGGINAPKRIEVLCSDGIQRPQLLKGKDDMRQDAIMQQIFGVVNKILLLDRKMQKYHARIRTYKVVPFSRRSGILEWCENTIPIGNYLVGERDLAGRSIKKGAHEIYRPKDWKPSECLKKVSDISTIKSLEEKLSKFNEICDHIKPVFHNFFYEKFKNPGEHFERRLTYTISVAVSSMIGYILGIGDRHVQNILVDLKTAELIHIDFGVAFEQGKILPHPELIPFRLTRDIMAPFGVSGIDGIFRKACESTIEILRQNEKTLTTILEVLLYDPMYMWSIGASQARMHQLEGEEIDLSSDENVEHDLMASRALNCVKMKLKGMAENSSVRYPSIEGQVQYLIQAAINPAHLCKLFRGWQAYL